jgi:hypothetical protein
MRRLGNGMLRRRPSPAMVVAVIALVGALGGAAVALPGRNSVRSDDIAPKAVKTKDLAPKAVKAGKIGSGAVGPFKTDTMRLAAAPEEVSTGSNTAVDLGGPNVTVKVPKGALVAVLAEVEMRVAGGGVNSEAEVRLFEPGSVPTSPRIIATGSNSFEDRFTAPGPGNGEGASGQLRGGPLVFSPGRGTRTFSLRYSGAGGGTALFRNRRLWVDVIG